MKTKAIPPFITLTGADEQTDIGMLQKLDAEIGLLYSTHPEGRKRYPGADWIMSAAANLPRVAIHICGGAARGELINGLIYDLVEDAQRIQVNGSMAIRTVELICSHYPEHTIITQHNHENRALLAVKAKNHALVVDASGGRGRLPEKWHRPDTHKQVGFAGGLGPDNLNSELPFIARAAGGIGDGVWWVDMETSLRVNDEFSLDRAQQAAWAFHVAWRSSCVALPELKRQEAC